VNEEILRRYIAFEGIDGAGKTLMTRLLAGWLRERGVEVVSVKEPWLPENRRFLNEADPSPLAEALIFAADRLVLQHSVVRAALERGAVVVSDRSVYSSLAYQCARGLEEGEVLRLNGDAVFPGTVFLLDIPVDEALGRIDDRELTRFERREFLEEVRRRYLSLAERYGFHVVDASKTPPEILEEVVSRLEVVL